MKYRYLYQTKENENQEGEIKAPNRAEAYARLRKLGIKPYRLIGDDPPRWRNWAIGVCAAVMLIAVAVVATVVLMSTLSSDAEETRMARHQLSGDETFISRQIVNGWRGVFVSGLDRVLSIYAQPGIEVFEKPLSDGEIAELERDLASEPGLTEAMKNRPEANELLSIVKGMRKSFAEYCEKGGDLRGYLAMLDERQQEEAEFRSRAFAALSRAPLSVRKQLWMNLNIRLKERQMPLIPEHFTEEK